MTDRHDPEGFEGFERVEDRLRGALTREATGFHPDDRLGDIRAAASPTSARRRSWLPPIAAAAAVAVLAAGAWIALRPASAPAPVPATPSTTNPVSPLPSTPPVASATGTGSATATNAPALTVAVALPVYYVAPPGSADGHYTLVRVFVPGRLPVGATAAQKADAALAAAVAAPASQPEPVRRRLAGGHDRALRRLSPRPRSASR